MPALIELFALALILDRHFFIVEIRANQLLLHVSLSGFGALQIDGGCQPDELHKAD